MSSTSSELELIEQLNREESQAIEEFKSRLRASDQKDHLFGDGTTAPVEAEDQDLP